MLYFTFPQKLYVLKLVPFTHSDKLETAYRNKTYQQKEGRMQELVESLRRTLNHSIVGKLYIFYQDPLLIPYLHKQNFKNTDKIEFVPNLEDKMAFLFRYANEHLEGHVVMVMNADVYPDEGFEKINLHFFEERKLMYSISRYVPSNAAIKRLAMCITTGGS